MLLCFKAGASPPDLYSPGIKKATNTWGMQRCTGSTDSDTSTCQLLHVAAAARAGGNSSQQKCNRVSGVLHVMPCICGGGQLCGPQSEAMPSDSGSGSSLGLSASCRTNKQGSGAPPHWACGGERCPRPLAGRQIAHASHAADDKSTTCSSSHSSSSSSDKRWCLQQTKSRRVRCLLPLQLRAL
jgi:hypothetical protein